MRRTQKIGLAMLVCAAAAAAVGAFFSRETPKTSPGKKAAETRSALPDTLRAVTLYGPTSYFSYRDEEMGPDYDMLRRYAADNGMQLKLEVASSVPEMLEMLRRGDVDLIAYDVPRIAEYRKGVDFCGKNSITHQVLVQPKSDSIRDVTQLIGRTLYVEKDSKYQYRLMNLNEELGGGIGIEAVINDTIETADLVTMVNNGELPLTVTDSDMAAVCASVLKDIDVSTPVGLDQYASWAVAAGDTLLANSLDRWAASNDIRNLASDAQKKYFEHSIEMAIESSSSPGGQGVAGGHGINAPAPRDDGTVSAYDAIFRKYAAQIGWDWRELAAIGYTESKFNPSAVSWAGARGLMQVMPASAKAYGISGRMDDPDASVYAASRILTDLDKSLSKHVGDPAERRKFVFASYNSGLGHVLDAIALAKKYGRNPQLWYGNVRDMALAKTKPQFYNDPVVKHGYFRGQETVDFVDRVLGAYERFSQGTTR